MGITLRIAASPFMGGLLMQHPVLFYQSGVIAEKIQDNTAIKLCSQDTQR